MLLPAGQLYNEIRSKVTDSNNHRDFSANVRLGREANYTQFQKYYKEKNLLLTNNK